MRWASMFSVFQQAEQSLPPVPRGLRVAVRVFLAVLIAAMLFYMLVEQIGSRRRR